MKKKRNISMKIIRRLPKYHMGLQDFLNKGVYVISSEDLSRRTGISAGQIRQDFNKFKCLGVQGHGYIVREVYDHICKILNINRQNNAVIIGAGNIGQALVNYSEFKKLGLNIVGIFDINHKILGLRFGDMEIQDLDDLPVFLKNNEVQIGVICVSEDNARDVCNILIYNGVKAIWNFAPVDLIAPEDVVIENAHIGASLLVLSHRMNSSV